MQIKKILVPTDFSACAGYATDLAVKLAQQYEANVYLYTQIPVHPLWNQLPQEVKEKRPKDFVELYELKKRFEEVVRKYKGTGVSFFTTHSAGSMLRMVENLVEEEGIDLIVMGSRGSSGVSEVVFGSNAQKMVRMAPCPLLVVKKQVEDFPFERVIFASDFEKEAEIPFRRLIDLLAPFPKTDLQLLYVRLYPQYVASPEIVKRRIQRFEGMAKGLQVSHHSLDDQSIEAGIGKFARDQQANLVTMARTGHSWLYRVALGSSVEALINHFDLPILVLNDKNQ
jgi:nucleotide-binding universal stress UspA family protein